MPCGDMNSKPGQQQVCILLLPWFLSKKDFMMNQPKLKYPRLCRILTYVVVIGAGMLPIILVFQFPVPDGVKVVVLLASLCGLLVYLIRNFLVLMMLDMTLALLSCYRAARSRYPLPPHRSAEAIRSSILRYGIACAPTPIST